MKGEISKLKHYEHGMTERPTKAVESRRVREEVNWGEATGGITRKAAGGMQHWPYLLCSPRWPVVSTICLDCHVVMVT